MIPLFPLTNLRCDCSHFNEVGGGPNIKQTEMKRGFALPFISIVDNCSEFIQEFWWLEISGSFWQSKMSSHSDGGLNKIYAYANIGLIVITMLFKLSLIK